MTQRMRQVDETDVRVAIASLEARVRERRQFMGAGSAASGDDDIRAVADNWFVSAHLPITRETPLVGRALALTKRVTRLLLRWYINPIVDQQNDFNAVVSRAFVRVAAQQEALAHAVAELERRVQAMEVASRQSPVASASGQSPAASDRVTEGGVVGEHADHE